VDTIFTTNVRANYLGFNLGFIRLSNGVFIASTEADSTCCNNYNKVGGIYVSVDEGSSWFQANENLSAFTYKDQQYTSDGFRKGLPAMKLTQIGDFVYGHTWRRNINDFKFKSISGITYFDLNNNGKKDSSENVIPKTKVSSSTSGTFTISSDIGQYSLSLEDRVIGDTILTVAENKYVKVNPPFYILNKAEHLVNKDFGVFFPKPVNDIQINITNVTPPRPGFKSVYFIDYKNIGSTTLNGKITLKYDALQAFDSASIKPTSNLNRILIWDYTNLKPFENRKIILELTTTRTASLRSSTTNIVQIDPLSIDTFKADNIDSLVQTIVGSYDPNDKQVTFNNSKIPPPVIDQSTQLIYTIRFQNTGNYPADFVKIVDTLSDKLDLSTFRLIATSHKGDVSVRNKNVLTFDFNPIYLPDSLRDEKGSHGFVKFAIKPKKTLTKDEAIKNTGYIYFDYNPAIVTNTVETTNLKTSLFTPSVSAGKLDISPNPTQNIIKVEIEDSDFKEGTLSIYDLSGRLMLTKSISNKIGVIDVSRLGNGEYICTVKSSENKVFVSKFVKL
jgi:uncharacterized repeat protein (TIGR01451 family)